MPDSAATNHVRSTPQEHLYQLEVACGFFHLDRGRVVRYRDLLRECLVEGVHSAEHDLAYNESAEVLDIYRNWRHHLDRFPGLKERIARDLLKGPVLREQENPARNTNEHRNNSFSYLIAGAMLNTGIDVLAVEGVLRTGAACHMDGDSTIDFEGVVLDFQNKRPQVTEALVPRMKQAVKQIVKVRPAQLGLVAVDCSAAMRPKYRALKDRSPRAAYEQVNRYLIDHVAPYAKTQLKPHVLAALLVARVPTMIEEPSPIVTASGRPFVWVSAYTTLALLGIVNNDSVDPELAARLVERLRQLGNLVGALRH